MKWLLAPLFGALPLFAALFAVTTKPAPINLESYLGRYISLILLFAVWGLFRSTALRALSADKTDKKYQIVQFILILILIGVVLTVVSIFHLRFEKHAYDIALLMMAFSALWSRYIFLKRYSLAAFFGLLANIGIGFLSFQVVLFEWEWQPLIFSVPFACASVLINLALNTTKETSKELDATFKTVLFLMPLSIGFLAFMGTVPSVYLGSFLFLPLMSLWSVSPHSEDRLFRIFLTVALFLVCLAALDLIRF